MSGGTKITLDVVKHISTDCSPFSKIIYFYKNNQNVLIEDTVNDKAYHLPYWELSNIIGIRKVKTPWTRSFDGRFFRFNEDVMHEAMPLNEPSIYRMKYITKPFRINVDKNGFDLMLKLKEIQRKEKDFKLFVEILKIDQERDYMQRIQVKYNYTYVCSLHIEFYAPLFEIWVLVANKCPSHIYMRIKDEFYKFPYGNVNNENLLCMPSPKNGYKNPEMILANILTTSFNEDYSRHVKFPYIFQSENTYVPIPVTYDLDYIHRTIKESTNNDRKKLSFIDLLYYLSNIEDIDNLMVDKIFLKSGNPPWDDKEIISNKKIKQLIGYLSDNDTVIGPGQRVRFGGYIIINNNQDRQIYLDEILYTNVDYAETNFNLDIRRNYDR